MWAVVTTGTGGYDKLEYQEVPRPVPQAGEVLINVLAAGVNNTEVNTRAGWYSKSVTVSSNDMLQRQEAQQEDICDGGWGAPTPWPLIQGTDCCGRVEEAADPVHSALLGKRVIVRASMRPEGFGSWKNVWMGSDFNGAFAQYVCIPGSEVFAVPDDCAWTNAELAAVPCAYGTSETMLNKAKVATGDHVLIPGASGGVGTAAVQLCKIRGARVTAITSAGKEDRVAALGADRVLTRGDVDWVSLKETVDVVVDNVGGEDFDDILESLKRGGRLVTSGAVGGPLVRLDMRTLYLKNLSLFGTTAWDEACFPSLIEYIKRDEFRPVVEKTYPLAQIATAQRDLATRKHLGKIVLLPPPPESASTQ